MATVRFATAVDFAHPPSVAFRYLVEPRNRPEWQASLLSVRLDDKSEAPHPGMRWRDTTMAGVKPHMEITELKPFRLFSEQGRWRGVTGILTLRFVATPTGSRVVAEGAIHGSGVWSAPARAAGALARRSIRSDLKRADRVLTDRGPRE
ncbi:MAG: SRPBCC family protein [Nocardioides sp.]|jgi:uncharacterized protein YndB with AHSA1/START domain